MEPLFITTLGNVLRLFRGADITEHTSNSDAFPMETSVMIFQAEFDHDVVHAETCETLFTVHSGVLPLLIAEPDVATPRPWVERLRDPTEERKKIA